MNHFRRRNRMAVATVVAVVVLVALLTFQRLRQTAEYQAWFADDKTRVDLCRALSDLAPSRADRVVRHLLGHDSPEVKAAAITAVAQGAGATAALAMVTALAIDENQPDYVREKSALLHLRRKAPLPAALESYMATHHQVLGYRKTCPQSIAAWLCRGLAEKTEPDLKRLLETAVDPEDPVRQAVRDLLVDQPQSFKPVRDHVEALLAREHDPLNRRFLSRIQAVVGRPTITPPPPVAPGAPGSLVEAEWATDITPNYQIKVYKGARCLALGEGAGGYISWLRGDWGSLDIGTARIALYAPQKANYRLFARVLMEDKCGNSFGLQIGDRYLGNFKDYENILGAWHWLPLKQAASETIHLDKGYHVLKLKAWEDAVYIDAFALVLADRDREQLTHPSPLWEAPLPGSVSIACDWQTQPRGTTQTVSVWIRRPSLQYREGALTVSLPTPFKVLNGAEHQVVFEDNDPLARVDLTVELPAGAPAGEGFMTATYRDRDQTLQPLVGSAILGAHFDWLTTGPLAPDDPLNRTLSLRQAVDDQDISTWKRFPLAGYDTYRRLDPEKAWGQLQNRYIYLCTDLRISQTDEYTAFLTVDDQAVVWIDGREWIARRGEGPGEGRMEHRALRLEAGSHRLLVQWYQADFPDPTATSARLVTANYCNFKFVVRHGRYQPAPAVRGLPFSPKPPY